jgi:hypothetical protein
VASQPAGFIFPAVGTGSLQRNQENKPEDIAGVAFQVPLTGVTELVPSATKVPAMVGATVLVGSLVTAVVKVAFFFVGVVRLTELAKTVMNLPTKLSSSVRRVWFETPTFTQPAGTDVRN